MFGEQDSERLKRVEASLEQLAKAEQVRAQQDRERDRRIAKRLAKKIQVSEDTILAEFEADNVEAAAAE